MCVLFTHTHVLTHSVFHWSPCAAEEAGAQQTQHAAERAVTLPTGLQGLHPFRAVPPARAVCGGAGHRVVSKAVVHTVHHLIF